MNRSGCGVVWRYPVLDRLAGGLLSKARRRHHQSRGLVDADRVSSALAVGASLNRSRDSGPRNITAVDVAAADWR